jgi:hypothetical protein
MRRSRSNGDAGGGLALAIAAGCAMACGGIAARPPAQACSAGEVVVIASQADVARWSGCAMLGGMIVRTGAALDVSGLRALTAITGDLVIGPTVAVTAISLGALRTVGGAVRVVGNGQLQGLSLPQLERVGRIEIDGNPVLITAALPRLESVRGALRITDNAALEAVDLSALAAVDGDVVVSGAPTLTLIDVPALAHAAAVELDAPQLLPEIAERLRAVAR